MSEASPIRVNCPSCKAGLRVPPKLAGKRIRCTKCAKPIDVPELPSGGEKARPNGLPGRWVWIGGAAGVACVVGVATWLLMGRPSRDPAPPKAAPVAKGPTEAKARPPVSPPVADPKPVPKDAPSPKVADDPAPTPPQKAPPAKPSEKRDSEDPKVIDPPKAPAPPAEPHRTWAQTKVAQLTITIRAEHLKPIDRSVVPARRAGSYAEEYRKVVGVLLRSDPGWLEIQEKSFVKLKGGDTLPKIAHEDVRRLADTDPKTDLVVRLFLLHDLFCGWGIDGKNDRIAFWGGTGAKNHFRSAANPSAPPLIPLYFDVRFDGARKEDGAFRGTISGIFESEPGQQGSIFDGFSFSGAEAEVVLLPTK